MVEGLALALVDRPGIAVAEAGEFLCRPRHFPALAGRRVEHRAQFAAALVDRGDRAGIAVVDAGPFGGVGELHPVADRKEGGPVFGLERDFRPRQFTALAADLAQIRRLARRRRD